MPQDANADFPIFVTLFGMVTAVRAEHQENARSGIEVKAAGNQRLVRVSQPENAISPNVDNSSGSTTLDNLEQFRNAHGATLVTVGGTSYVPVLPVGNLSSVVLLESKRTPPRLLYNGWGD
jgi:hypothetical protein